MNLASVIASYRRGLDPTVGGAGQRISITRDAVTCTALARVTGDTEEVVVDGIAQFKRKIILFASDLSDPAVNSSAFPEPIRRGDILTINGRQTSVQTADDTTRSFAGVTIAYEIMAIGA